MSVKSTDWVSWAEWRSYVGLVRKRAWDKAKGTILTFVCIGIGGGLVCCVIQYFERLRTGPATFLLIGATLGGAIVSFLGYFTVLFISAPAKMAAEAEHDAKGSISSIDTIIKEQQKELDDLRGKLDDREARAERKRGLAEVYKLSACFLEFPS